MNDPSPLASILESFKEGREEARREQKARHLEYQSKFVERFNYSPREFYILLAKCLEERRVPGLEAGFVKLFESIVGSSRRLYMKVARERFAYYVCAAPYGSGFFFSWRLVDERRPAQWFHFVALFVVLAGTSAILSYLLFRPLISFLAWLGVDSTGLAQTIPFVPAFLFLFEFSICWSLMRCASLPSYERLALFVERIPILGRIFERLFRPDTYYRQDSLKMYQKAFDNAIQDAINSVVAPQGVRQRNFEGVPVVDNLHGK